jgi:hypothetical protein
LVLSYLHKGISERSVMMRLVGLHGFNNIFYILEVHWAQMWDGEKSGGRKQGILWHQYFRPL